MSTKAQEAVVLGSEYVWHRETLSQSAAPLWRTTPDFDHARGWSGSVLCQGTPTDTEARAVLFQNFQTSLQPEAARVDGRHIVSAAAEPLPKGGFLLPCKIRKSTIRVMRGERSLEPTFLNAAQRQSAEPKRFETL